VNSGEQKQTQKQKQMRQQRAPKKTKEPKDAPSFFTGALARLKWNCVKQEELRVMMDVVASGAADLDYNRLFQLMIAYHGKSIHHSRKKEISIDGPSIHALSGAILSSKFKEGVCSKNVHDSLMKLSKGIESIRVIGTQIILKFNFRWSTESLYLPSPPGFVLDSRNKADPLLVCPQNKLIPVKSEVRTIVLNKTVHLNLNENGNVDSVNPGEVYAKLLMKFQANLRTTFLKGRVDTDDKKRAYVVVDSQCKPVVVNGHYQLLKYDHWLIISVMGRDIFMGLPPLPQLLRAICGL
jgi:hypothetical protein